LRHIFYPTLFYTFEHKYGPMLFKTLFTLIACCALLFSKAQTGEPVMEIGSKKMNLHVIDEVKGSKSKYAFAFVKDTMAEVKLPRNMWKIDTTVQLDLITQEEKTVLLTDSTMRVHIHLGAVTKQELIAAVGAGFNLSKHCQCNIASVDLLVIDAKGSTMHIDYAKPEQLESAGKKIESLAVNSAVIVLGVNFKCADNQSGMDDINYTDLAIVKIKE